MVIGIRDFNTLMRDSVSVVTLTVVSAFAGIGASRNSNGDTLTAIYVLSLIYCLSAVHFYIKDKPKSLKGWLYPFFGALAAWFPLKYLTELPITSATILTSWILFSWLLQVRARHEKLDDERAGLLKQRADLEQKILIRECLLPIEDRLFQIKSAVDDMDFKLNQPSPECKAVEHD